MSAKCIDCGMSYDGFDSHMVMLHNYLWEEVSAGDVRICLCDKCIEKRLGRRIAKEDLIPNLPVNDLYIQMYLDL